MAIVTVHRSFGNDKFPLKAIPSPKSHNHVYISTRQLDLVCPDLFRVYLVMGSDGIEYGVFHKENVHFQ